jgi:molybdate transport system substrate-binding protein
MIRTVEHHVSSGIVLIHINGVDRSGSMTHDRSMKIFLLVALALVVAARAQAAELQVIAGGGMVGPLKILAPQFESATGHKLTIRFAATPELIKLATGTPFDVAVVPREVFNDEAAKAMFVPGPTVDIARVGFGVAVRAGVPKPDIGSPEALKQTLLKARSIAMLPSSAAGAQVLKTFDRLGIADEMKAKTKIQPSPADIPQAVARGEAELGVFLLNVLAAPGVDLVGPFPPELQQELLFTSSVAAKAGDAAAARAFIDFLRTPAALAVMKSQGMTVG